MPKFDSYSSMKVVNAVAPVSHGSTSDITGITVDTQGFEECTFALLNGLINDLVSTVLIEDSPDDSVWTAVTDANLLGLESDLTIAADDDTAVAQIGYNGGQRYVRLSYIVTTGSGANLIGAICILTAPHRAPTTAPTFA